MAKRDNHTIRVEVTPEVMTMIAMLSDKLGIKRSDIAGIWMGMLNANDKLFIEKVMHVRAVREVERMSKTRNALMARVQSRGVLKRLDNMTDDEFERLLDKIVKLPTNNK